MSKTANGPALPAFPALRQELHGSTWIDVRYPGMTKRELFAAMAMQGLLANDDVPLSYIGAAAVKQADALLAALEGGRDDER